MINLEFASYIDKLPPACIEAEEAVLGGLLMDPNAFSLVHSMLQVESFSINSHQLIYRAMINMYKEEREVNLLTVIDWLRRKNKLVEAGGKNKLANLVDRVVSTVNIDALAKLVNEKFIRRKLIEVGHEIANRGFDEFIDVKDYLERCKKNVEEIFNHGIESEADKIGREYESLIKKINDIELSENNPGRKQMRLMKLARSSGYSLRELENLYRKSLADFSQTALKSIGDLLKEYGDDDRRWFMHGFIPEATTILLHAQGGIGKTKLAYEIAYNLIEGTSWGGYPVTKQCKVLCYQTDESPQDMKHALQARGFADSGRFMYRDNWVVDAIPQLIADIKSFQPEFVVIDSLTTVSRHSVFSENDTEYARPLLQMAQIAKEYGCTIMVVHHSNADDRSRGTRAIFNSVSEVWSFKEDKKEGASDLEKLLHIEKSRSRAPMIYRLRFDPDYYSWHCLQREGGVSTDNGSKDRVLKFLCANRNIPYEVEEIANHTGIAKSTAARVLNYLKAEGAISRKDRGQKNKPYCYYINTNASHTPLKPGCTDEKNFYPSTTGNTENASHGNKMLLTTDEKNETTITTGVTENASHPPAFFSENNFEKKSEKSQQGEKHSTKPNQSMEKILLTPPSQNASHPEKNHEKAPLGYEQVKPTSDTETEIIHQTKPELFSIKEADPNVITITKIGHFGLGKVVFTPLSAIRSNSKTECKIECFFPDNTYSSVSRYIPLKKREKLEQAVEKKMAEWEEKYLLEPSRIWDVEQMGGTEGEPEMVWIKGCQCIEVAHPPVNTWYRFRTPQGEILKVGGLESFRPPVEA